MDGWMDGWLITNPTTAIASGTRGGNASTGRQPAVGGLPSTTFSGCQPPVAALLKWGAEPGSGGTLRQQPLATNQPKSL